MALGSISFIFPERLKELGLIDQIVAEPLGGAHRDMDAVALNLKHALCENLGVLESLSPDELLDSRYERLMAYGNFGES